MHSDHRRRYHVRPADQVYPGDRISADQQAIDAVNGDLGAEAAVDWDGVEAAAALVRDRTRTHPTTLRFTTTRGDLKREVGVDILVVKDRTDGTA